MLGGAGAPARAHTSRMQARTAFDVSLAPQALVEQILVGRERQSRRPQAVAEREWEVKRNDRVAYPERARRAQAHLLLDLEP